VHFKVSGKGEVKNFGKCKKKGTEIHIHNFQYALLPLHFSFEILVICNRQMGNPSRDLRAVLSSNGAFSVNEMSGQLGN
jgi:hypothetical protein